MNFFKASGTSNLPTGGTRHSVRAAVEQDFGVRGATRSTFPRNVAGSVTFVASLAIAVLAGCAVGPNYHQPKALKSQPLPASFNTNETSSSSTEWKAAEPSADIPRGRWWELFGDAELNRLETLAAAENQSLLAATARFAQARALVNVAKANFYPQLSTAPGVTRQRTSFNAPSRGDSTDASFTYNTFSVPLDLTWELDLWGRVRRQTEAAKARFNAVADDLESARLTLQAEVAADYFTLRALEAQSSSVSNSIETFRRSLELTQNRRKGGIVSDLDVSQAETQLRATEAVLPALELQRAKLLHALAALCGQSATGFQIQATAKVDPIPAVPVSLPSELLERRPDIASFERRMAAANADIGVAKGAFYPRVTFNGAAGLQSVSASSFFDWPSRFWAIGPTVELPLFTGGRNRANLTVAYAAYDETVADYRQTVLTAFQEVEDQLAAQRLLATQFEAQSAALNAARHTLEIANNRYKAGLITYLEVATAQNVALQHEQTVAQLQGERLVTQVTLIKALGGGWKNQLLATDETQIEHRKN